MRFSNWNCQKVKIPTEPGQHMWFQMCVCVCSCVCVCVCVRLRTCLLECKCMPQSAHSCPSSTCPCHSPRIHQAVVHHMYCAFFCHCTRRSQNSIMACDIREFIPWVRLDLLFAHLIRILLAASCLRVGR